MNSMSRSTYSLTMCYSRRDHHAIRYTAAGRGKRRAHPSTCRVSLAERCIDSERQAYFRDRLCSNYAVRLHSALGDRPVDSRFAVKFGASARHPHRETSPLDYGFCRKSFDVIVARRRTVNALKSGPVQGPISRGKEFLKYQSRAVSTVKYH